MVPFHSFLVGVPCLSWVPLCFIDTVQLLFCPAVILDPTNYTLGSDFIVSLLWSHPFLVEWYHSVLVVHFIFSFFSMCFGTHIRNSFIFGVPFNNFILCLPYSSSWVPFCLTYTADLFMVKYLFWIQSIVLLYFGPI